MCRSMVDIQSTAAEIRRGKKRKKKERKIEITGQKYNVQSAMQGGHKNKMFAYYDQISRTVVELDAFQL